MTEEELYEYSVRAWISRKTNLKAWPEDISDVKFGEGNYGVCPTCDDPFVAITYTITRNGKSQQHEMDIENISVFEIIKECMEIYKTLAAVQFGNVG